MSELYTLPDGWEWKTFDDELILIQNGLSDTQNDDKIGYPISRIETIQNETLDSNRIKYIDVDNYSIIEKYKYDYGDLLFSHINSFEKVGKTCLYTNQIDNLLHGVNLLRMKFTRNVISKFVFYYLISNVSRRFYEPHIKKAINQASINQKNIKSIPLPLPPLEEQKRIVTKLDNLFAKIDKAIALHQKNIDESNVFIASVLNDVFVELEEKYEKFNINKIATVKGGKRVPKGYTLSEEVTPYPYLRVTDFKDYGTICTKKMLYLTEEVYEQIKRYTITDEDLYITNVGNTIGKSGIIPSELNGANLTENAVKLVYKDKKNTSNKFIYYFTKTSIFLIQLESATMQMAVPKLAIMRLGEIELPFPPITTQQKVVSYLDEISQKMEKIKQIQKEKMQSLKALKASILDQAFKGEL